MVRAAGIALSALAGGAEAALGSAVLFGATFTGISTLALAPTCGFPARSPC
jgi:hypothetical protein